MARTDLIKLLVPFAATLLVAGSAAAQVAPGRRLPETWEDLSPTVQRQLDRMVTPLRFQPSIIAQLSPADGAAQVVEPGAVVVSQRFAPARAVRLTTAPRRKTYGEVGSLLWEVRSESKTYWCLLSPFNLSTGYNYYCYDDTDLDGVFDAVYEAPYDWGFEDWGLRSYTGFVNFRLGRDEKLGKPVKYEPADPIQDRGESLELQYQGVHAGLITDDGFVRPGIVRFGLRIVADPVDGMPRGILPLKVYDIELNDQGVGAVDLPSGFRISIEKVEVGGRATVRITGGMRAGETFIYPAATRDDIFKRYLLTIGAPPAVP